MSAKWLLFLLVLLMTPAGAEAAESAAHFLRDGDFVHAIDGRHPPPPTDPGSEHGCAAVLHACHYHGQSQTGTQVSPDLGTPVMAGTVLRFPAVTTAVGIPDHSPLLRPPIA